MTRKIILAGTVLFTGFALTTMPSLARGNLSGVGDASTADLPSTQGLSSTESPAFRGGYAAPYGYRYGYGAPAYSGRSVYRDPYRRGGPAYSPYYWGY